MKQPLFLKNKPPLAHKLHALTCLFLLLPFVFVTCLLPFSDAKSANLTELQKRKHAAEQKIHRIELLKRQIKAKSQDLTQHIIENQQRTDDLEEDLGVKQKELGVSKVKLSGLQVELQKALAVFETKKTVVKKRIRRFYMEERIGLLQLLLDSRSLPVLMDRMYYKQRIYNQDKKLIADYVESIRVLNNKKNALQRENMRLQTIVKTIQRSQVMIENAIDLDSAYKDKLDNDLEAYESAQNQLEAESRAIEGDILVLIRQQQGSHQPPVKSTGIFARPVNGRLTSGFGYRVHPISRRRKMHTGTDFSAPTGTSVYAADGGRVIFAGWRGGYGKVIIINHGERGGVNFTTLYGHLSAINIGNGQGIAKGQMIGRVGTTGYSTGPHLHFEVRINGSPVNPMSYLR